MPRRKQAKRTTVRTCERFCAWHTNTDCRCGQSRNGYVVHHGDSGGPLLSANEQDERLILGVNVLAYSSIVELQEQSKEGALAVSAASITQFLASQVIGSVR